MSLAQFMFHQFDLLMSYLFIIYSFIHFFFSGCQQYLRATLQDSSILVPYSFSISLLLSLESCKIIIIIALEKRGGGIRPIAVGCTLRRLVAKIACGQAVGDMADLLSPRQLGFGVKGGIEAAVHAARLFLYQLPPDEAFVKLDFKNAFNSLRRDRMLDSVLSLCPSLYPLAYSYYSSPSSLFWGMKSFSRLRGYNRVTL